MKSIGSSLRTHLDGTVTTLATLWRIERTDGVSFYFTDHDVDITFEGNTYDAETGYNRSAVANNVGLSVDNIDVEGVFDSSQITELDLRAGKFDYAEVFVAIVNWADLSQGQLRQRRGRLGEVIVTEQGIFRAELRGLTQLLSQSIIENYQPECRADLGDTQCKIPIYPAAMPRGAAVTVGTNYRVPSADATVIEWSDVVTNGGFEDATLGTNLTTVASWTVVSGTFDIVTTDDALSPQEGVNFLTGGNAAGEIRQDVQLFDSFGLTTTQIDSGDCTASFSAYRANSAADDTGRVIVQFLDVDFNPTGTLYDSTAETILPLDTWVQKSASDVTIPAGSLYIRIRFITTLVTGGKANACLDNVTLSVTASNTQNSYQEVFQNVIHTITTAGTTNPLVPASVATSGTTTESAEAAEGTVTLAGAAGSVDSITVDGVEIMSGAESFDTDLPTTATNVAANITAHTSSPNYTAAAVGSVVTITAASTGTGPNGFDVVASTTTMTASTTDMAGGGAGGVAYAASNAWTRHGTVTKVIDRRTMLIEVTEPRASDDWFNGGAITFESGLNESITTEIRDWVQSTGQLTMFLPAPFPVFKGTKVRLYPGCDKRLETCHTRFANVFNYRGEPHVPGQDELMSYPDSR